MQKYWRKILLALAAILNWRFVLVTLTVIFIFGFIFGFILWRFPPSESLPNGIYNVGLIKLYGLNSDITLTNVELTNNETILTVEYVNKFEGKLDPLQVVSLKEKAKYNQQPIEYTFLKSEPLTFREPLYFQKGQRLTLKFYFERVKGYSPKSLDFKFGSHIFLDNHEATFILKKP